MNHDFPSPSPTQFRPFQIDTPLYDRLLLPNGRRVGEISTDHEEINEYCLANFNESWHSLRFSALSVLADRLNEIQGRIPPLQALLEAGQPSDTLIPSFGHISEALQALANDGSIEALVILGMFQLSVGHHFMPGRGLSKGRKTIREAIRLGSTCGHVLLGDSYLEAGEAEKAAGAYTEGYNQGCSVCCYQLAKLHEKGAGPIPRDQLLAFKFYRCAHENNYPPAAVAMVRLWLRSAEILPLPCDPTVLAEDAFASGCDGAGTLLAELYEVGDGARSNPLLAVSLYRCAAIQGDPEAQIKLADMLAGISHSDLPVAPDKNEAEQWYLRICGTSGLSSDLSSRAYFEMGKLLMWRRDYEGATHFFYKACQLGCAEASTLHRVCAGYADNRDI